jgi:type II secretory pathway pseudopilin PulG
MSVQISKSLNPCVQIRRQCRAQEGYALLLVMFLAAMLAISVMAVVPNILTEGRRQREEEMIWRGKQYIRGIKLYNRKLGHFPTSLDDLTKPKTGSIRFMRAAYKDPMNKEDGSWRLIYVGPAGQLIGSLKPPDPSQMQGAGGLGTAASTVAGNSAGGFGTPGLPGSSASNSSSFGSPSTGSFGNTSNSGNGFGSPSSFGNSNAPANGLVNGLDANGQPLDPANDPMLNPSGAALQDAPTIVGGNIIGVGSKINQHSIKVYEKAKNYLVFEFVYNPAKDTAAAIQQMNAPGSGGIGTPIGTPAGSQTPFGQSPTGNAPEGAIPPTQPQPQNPPQQ